jgi:ribonuclease HI
MSNKFYAVLKGRIPGIYESWNVAKQQVDGHAGAKFRGFTSRVEANAWLAGRAITEAPKPDPLGPLSVLLGSEEVPVETTWLIAFDGGSRSNPGRAASAISVWNPKGILVAEIGHYHDENRSSNYAEWYALNMALQYIKNNNIPATTIQGDSMLVIEQVCGRFTVAARHLQEFAREVSDVLSAACESGAVKWIGIKHVRRAHNKEADRVVNEALDKNKTIYRVNTSAEQTMPEE